MVTVLVADGRCLSGGWSQSEWRMVAGWVADGRWGGGSGVAVQDAHQDRALGRTRGGMPVTSLVGDADEHSPPVVVAHRTAHQAGAFESGDQARHRALTEVSAVGELLDAVALLTLFDHVVEDFEVTRADPVLGAELVLESAPGGGMLGEQISPGAYHSLLVHERHLNMRTHFVWMH